MERILKQCGNLLYTPEPSAKCVEKVNEPIMEIHDIVSGSTGLGTGS